MLWKFTPEEQAIIDREAIPEMGRLFVVNCNTFYDLVWPHEKEPQMRAHFEQPRSLQRLGKLNQLPPELLLMIVADMDLLTAVRFRLVNKAAHCLVEIDEMYQVVTAKHHNTWQVLPRTGCASQYTIRHVYNLLHDDRCAITGCKRIGNLLNLSGRYRVCAHHLDYMQCRKDWGLRSLEAVSHILDIPKEEIRRRYSAVFTTVTGWSVAWYANRRYKSREVVELVCTRSLISEMSRKKARRSGFDRVAYEKKLEKSLRKAPWDYSWKYRAVMEMPSLKKHTEDLGYIYSCPSCGEELNAEDFLEHIGPREMDSSGQGLIIFD